MCTHYGVSSEIACIHSENVVDTLKKTNFKDIIIKQYGLKKARIILDYDEAKLFVVATEKIVSQIKYEIENDGKERKDGTEFRSFLCDCFRSALEKVIYFLCEYNSENKKYQRCYDTARAIHLIEKRNKITLFDGENLKNEEHKSKSNINILIWNMIMKKLAFKWKIKDNKQSEFDEKIEDDKWQFNYENRFRWCMNHHKKNYENGEGNLNSSDIFTIYSTKKSSIMCKFENRKTTAIYTRRKKKSYKGDELITKFEKNTNNSCELAYDMYGITNKNQELINKIKPINNFNVIRFEAQNITDNKILQILEQRFYTFKNDAQMTIDIFKFTIQNEEDDTLNISVKFLSKMDGEIGNIKFNSASSSDFLFRKLYRYSNYCESKYEKEKTSWIFINEGFVDPYGNDRPIPIKKIIDAKIKEDLILSDLIKIPDDKMNNNPANLPAYIAKFGIKSTNDQDKINEILEEETRKLCEYGDNLSAPALKCIANDTNQIFIWRLATDDGRNLSTHNDNWKWFLLKIEHFIRDKYNVSINHYEHKDEEEEEKGNANNSQKKHCYKFENTAEGFKALMFLVSLHFIDCVFTASYYPSTVNRNSKYDTFLYPYEWELDKSYLDKTQIKSIYHLEDNEDDNNAISDLISKEVESVKEKLKKLESASFFSIGYSDDKSPFFTRTRKIARIFRIENCQCYIGYRLHYHLLQMLGKNKIREKEYAIIGGKDDLKSIATFEDCYLMHSLIKQRNFKLIKLDKEEKIMLDNFVLIFKAIVENDQDEQDKNNRTVIRAMYPSYLIEFSDWYLI